MITIEFTKNAKDGEPITERKSFRNKKDMYDYILFDMLDTYNDEMQKVLRDHLVLELSPGGNELFGRAWNKETESKEDGE